MDWLTEDSLEEDKVSEVKKEDTPVEVEKEDSPVEEAAYEEGVDTIEDIPEKDIKKYGI